MMTTTGEDDVDGNDEAVGAGGMVGVKNAPAEAD